MQKLLDAQTYAALRDSSALPAKTMETLYEIYCNAVHRMNDLQDCLLTLDRGSTAAPAGEFRTLKLELADQMAIVHACTLFFRSLSGRAGRPDGTLIEAVQQNFGTWDTFLAELTRTALASRHWVLLGWDRVGEDLVLLPYDERTLRMPCGVVPLLALDVSEETARIDFEEKRARYIDALLPAIDWRVVGKRLDALGTTELLLVR